MVATKDCSILDKGYIAAPCPAKWNEMKGDDRVRFCAHCRLNVYNLSAMSRAEAEALVHRRDGRICVRFYRRKDGTMLTQNCPIGVRALQLRLRLMAGAAAGFLILATFGAINLLRN